MSELVSSKQIEDLVNKIVEDKLENYFRMSRPGFEIVSGHKVPGHGIGEFCLTTDTTQGVHCYEGGRGKIGANQSIEIYGGDGGTEDGKVNTKKDYGVVVEAINGSVLITAKHDLVLKGENVKILAEDTLQLNGDNLVTSSAPSIGLVCNNLDLIGLNKTQVIGGKLALYSETSVEIAEGIDDLLNTDIISRLTNLTDQIKRVLLF